MLNYRSRPRDKSPVGKDDCRAINECRTLNFKRAYFRRIWLIQLGLIVVVHERRRLGSRRLEAATYVCIVWRSFPARHTRPIYQTTSLSLVLSRFEIAWMASAKGVWWFFHPDTWWRTWAPSVSTIIRDKKQRRSLVSEFLPINLPTSSWKGFRGPGTQTRVDDTGGWRGGG